MRIPKVNASALIENRYFVIGRMMAAWILHDCRAPTFLAKSIVDYLMLDRRLLVGLNLA